MTSNRSFIGPYKICMKNRKYRTAGMYAILVGWPEKKEHAPALTRPYFSMCHELAAQDGLVFKGNSVMIPKNLRADVKLKIQPSFLGIEACLAYM